VKPVVTQVGDQQYVVTKNGRAVCESVARLAVAKFLDEGPKSWWSVEVGDHSTAVRTARPRGQS
jgi:hypothetical protein